MALQQSRLTFGKAKTATMTTTKRTGEDVTKGNETKEKGRSRYEWLDPKQHVLARPDTYVGSVSPCKMEGHVFVPLGKGEYATRMEETTASPALFKLWDEAIVNAIDNHRRDETQTEIRASVTKEGVFEVKNDGRTITTEVWDEEKTGGRRTPEILFGELLSGENFDDEKKRLGGGRNGIGVKVINLLSDWMEIVLVNAEEGVKYVQRFESNLSVIHRPKLTNATKAKTSSTTVRWKPDLSRLGMDLPLSDSTLRLLEARVFDAAACTEKRVRVFLNGEKIPFRTLKEYSLSLVRPFSLLSSSSETKEMKEETSQQETTQHNDAASTTREDDLEMDVCDEVGDDSCRHQTTPELKEGEWIGAEIGEEEGTRIEVCALTPPSNLSSSSSFSSSFSSSSSPLPPLLVGFVNGIRCSEGTHVDLVLRRIAEGMSDLVTKKRKVPTQVRPSQVRERTTLVVHLLTPNPSFSSQSKTKLDSKLPQSSSLFSPSSSLLKAFERRGVVDSLLSSFQRATDEKDLKSVDKALKTTRASVGAIPKYERATKLGKGCSLYITEGDSAKALALAGFSVVGRERNGVFPIRGKLLNVHGMPTNKALQNAEIKHLTQILGLDPRKTYDSDSVRSLPYERLVIFTDQDHDGSHIMGLLLIWLQSFFPSLLRAKPDFVSRFATPIVRASVGGRTHDFFSLPTFRSWLSSLPPSSPSPRVKYYKGLGTSTSAEGKAYFSDLDRHLIVVRHSGDPCSDTLDLFFSSSRAGERKDALRRFDPESYVDYGEEVVTVKDWCRDELTHFGYADNLRSLPHAIDGLKPSQRKVLFAMGKEKGEESVATIAASTTRLTAYHHAPESLVWTAVGMARRFPGSNNLALLEDRGQFGVRLNPKTTTAAARYIRSVLDPISSFLFRKEDDPILTYAVDDGRRIEPTFYVPVIPLVLVNGADGIGTGWSTFVPPHNPRDVISACRRIATTSSSSSSPLSFSSSPPLLSPWYDGFTGETARWGDEKGEEGGWELRGRVERNGSSLTVTELPPRVWTEPYKEWIQTHLIGEGKGRFVLSVVSSSDEEDKVRLDLKCKSEVEAKTDADLLRDLKLVSKIGEGNMHLFDREGRLRRYDSAEEILFSHAEERRKAYALRIGHDLSVARREHSLSLSKARFVDSVRKGEILLFKQTRRETIDQLEREGYPPSSGEGKGDKADKEHRESRFDYLLGLRADSFSSDASVKMREAASSAEKRILQLEAETEDGIWARELDELEAAYDSYLESNEARRVPSSSESSSSKKMTGRRQARGGEAKKKKKADA